ncbi:hypothetical protein G9A89_008592 [Geosiphon pyriformis]|nr:hypothetical protein G9A89_008592 [Geosiphon pyriformis]
MQAISYFLQNTVNLWYQSLVNKPQDFNAFKIEFLKYFSNNNSINKLANIFTTIKQEENEAVTIYLECFHRNLCQIQAINANYFTVAQILNQFIHRLYSSILQCICPMHPIDLQAAVTNTRDFEATELEANHVQAINLVMNGSSELDSKLKQFSNSINYKLKGYLTDNHTIYQPPQRCNNSGNVNHFQNQSHPSLLTNQQWQQKMHVCYYCELLTYDATATLSITSISNANLLAVVTTNLLATATTQLSATASGNILAPTNSNTTTELTSKWNPKAKIDPTKLEIINDTQPNNLESNQYPTLTSNILLTTITENKSLDTIFPFELEELSIMPLFSGAALEKKPITAMYTDAKVDGHFIKLILDSKLAGSIITKQLIDQLSYQVDRAASARIITTDGATKTPIDNAEVLTEPKWSTHTCTHHVWSFQDHQLDNTTYQIRRREEETYLGSLSSIMG